MGPSIYHLFNPGQQIPLNGVFRVLAHYATYDRNDDTAKNFEVPEDEESLTIRAGLRLGGKEPALFPDLAMEISVWYEGNFRLHSDRYGFDNDRDVESHSHLFWAQALLIYTLPTLGHTFYVGVIGGGSVNADRISAFRLGGYLPLISEFPLTLPGYYYQELTAKNFALFGGNYLIPFDEEKHWNLELTAATAAVDYLEGLEQPGHWNSGVGAGLLFKSKSWRVLTGYAYGVDAIRTHGRGANSVQLLFQIDLEKASDSPFNPVQPNIWQGMQRMFGMFGI
jgi:hypothetical protein